MHRFVVFFSCFFLTQMGIAQITEATLLGNWSNPELVPSSAHENTYNEVWGLSINGREIAIIGSTAGTHFIDVTDPIRPEEIHFLAGRASGPQIIHRDYHDHKGYLYCVADEGASTLQIVDIRNLPASIEVVYDSREYFVRSHNIFIDAATDRLYSLISNGDSIPFAPMRIFDISNPVDPKPIKAYNNFGGYSISQVHDAFVRNDTAYLNFGPKGLGIINFADTDNPEVLAILEPMDYPQAGYNHSGWLTPDGAYYYMADETYQSDIKVLDVRNLPEISIPTTINAGSDSPFTIPHNQIVHNGFLYSSYYFDGLQIYDISNPADPKRVSYYSTSSRPHSQAYQGAWGVYPFLPSGNILISDMQEGLFIVSHGTTSSVGNLLENSFTLYPNPTSEGFKIKGIPKKWNGGQIEILDVLGNSVYRQKLDSTANQDMSFYPDLSPGTYFVKIDSQNSHWTEELVIIR